MPIPPRLRLWFILINNIFFVNQRAIALNHFSCYNCLKYEI